MAQKHQNLWAAGTAPWSIKTYKERTLVALVTDLMVLEEEGIDDSICKLIKNALNKAVGLSEAMPDGSTLDFIVDS